MRVLITGGSSLLGKGLKETKPPGTYLAETWYTNFVQPPMYHLDICDKSQVSYVVDQVKPNVIIHCAAIGSVDYAEVHFKKTHKVNVTGTVNIAKAAKDVGAKFVYISTNAVFNGENPPYDEKSKRRPINRYGSIKREAENEVMKFNDWLIIRPFLLFGWTYPGGRNNWAIAALNALIDNRPMKIVNDGFWQPTFNKDCAEAIWQLIEKKKKNEIYHIASDDKMTLYEFARLVGKVWFYRDEKIDRLFSPASIKDFPDMAPRPVDTTYDLSKLHAEGIRLQSIEKGLKEMSD